MSKEITQMKNCAPAFCMEDGTEIKNSCWRLQEQTVNGEATGAHAGRHAAFTTTCYFCWFLFIVNWTLKKDHPKINIAFFTSPLLGGSRVLQRRILSEKCLEWVLDFMCWPMVRGWDKAAFRKPSAELGRGWSPRSCLGHVSYAHTVQQMHRLAEAGLLLVWLRRSYGDESLSK